MARINKKNIISGRIGDLVYRNVDDQQVVQPRPEDMKQTQATKLSSTEFVKCSHWAKILRVFLSPLLLGLTDTYMYKRLTGKLYATLQTNTSMLKGVRTPCNADMSELAGFEFNTHSPFADYFLPSFEVALDAQRQVTITMPELEPKTEIVFAEETGQAELLIYVLATNFDLGEPIIEAHFLLPIDKSTPILPETSWSSPVIPADYFVMVTAKLMFSETNKFTVKNYINNKELNPACVLFASCS